MTDDLRTSLGRIALDTVGALRPVPVDEVRRRIRRRRTVRRTAGVLGAVALLGSVGAGALALDVLGPRPVVPAVPSPAPSPTGTTTTAVPAPAPTPTPTEPVVGWVPGGGVCGTTWTATASDAPGIEIGGRVSAVSVDPASARLAPDPEGGTLYAGLWLGPEVPGEPVSSDGARPQVVLVDADGTVVFWNDPARQLPMADATDGSGGSLPSGLFDAVDCRTGRPLDGVLHAWATSRDEVAALAPVAFGPGTAAADPAQVPPYGATVLRDAPTCGEPLPADVLADPDLVAELDADVPRTGRSAAGIHAGVTLRPTGADVSGWLPQGLRAVLVDASGVVVSEVTDPGAGTPSGDRFAATGAAPVDAEVYQWFTPCSGFGAPPLVWPATYDLYVLDTVFTTDGTGTATVAGGPFPYTLDRAW